jgi:hypothetical protein
MEIGPGPGPEPEQPVTQNFTVSATGLVSRTLSLWFRKIIDYLVIVGVTILVWQLVSFGVLWLIWGDLAFDLVEYVAGDPLSFISSVYLLIMTVGTPQEVLPAEQLSFFIITNFVLMIIGTIIYAIVAGAAVKHALDDYGPRNADLGNSFSHASGRAFTLIFASIVVSILTALGFLPAIAVLVLFVFTLDLSLLLSALGLVLVGIILVIYLLVRFLPTTAVVIAEDKSAIESVKRAYSLTSGNFIHVLGGYILLMIAIIIINAVVILVLSPIGFIGGLISFVISIAIASLVLGPIPYVFHAVLYKDLVSRSATQPQDWW